MDTDKFIIRETTNEDCSKILDLYRSVSKVEGGLARTASEVSIDYVNYFTSKSLENGVQFVIIDKSDDHKIIAEIHCYQLIPGVFKHILSELTIAVDPNYHGLGLGKKIFQTLLNYISANRTDILRVELIARESNTRALKLYQTLGFKVEGRFENRIKTNSVTFEADIPMAWFNENFVNKSL